jgi:hypothetical protein
MPSRIARETQHFRGCTLRSLFPRGASRRAPTQFHSENLAPNETEAKSADGKHRRMAYSISATARGQET